MTRGRWEVAARLWEAASELWEVDSELWEVDSDLWEVASELWEVDSELWDMAAIWACLKAESALAYTESMDGHFPYDRHASKRPTRLRVNGDLLEKARELGVDLASTLEAALVLEVRKRQREAWLEENREAIGAYNEHVAEHGVFSAGLRSF